MALGHGIALPFNKGGLVVPTELTDGNTWARYISSALPDGSLAAWNDYYGSGHNLAQGTAGLRPVAASGIVTMNGTGQCMKTANITLVQPVLYMIVCRINSWTSGDYLFDGYTADSVLVYQNLSTPRIRAYAGTLSTENTNVTLGQWCVITAYFNGASSKLQVNDTAAVTGNFGAGNPGGFTLGSYASQGSGYIHADFKDVLIRNGASALNGEAAIRAYFRSLYGI